jgi:hypothetical protein
MSLTVFLALCILGCDFMIYMFFQWAYGEKRRAIARQVAAYRKAREEQPPRPFLVPARKVPAGLPELRRSAGERPPGSKPRAPRPSGVHSEGLARS